MPPRAAELQRKSPAEFFAENKNIAGFDNPGKCLYTTMRELVENSLDSAEESGYLPEIDVSVTEVNRSALNKIRGLDDHERLDAELYQDHETEAGRKKRLAQEARDAAKLKKLIEKKGENDVAVAKLRKEVEARAAGDSKSAAQYYKITVRDNGGGMRHEDIPDMLGRVLSGTKYGVKQTRGKFGLGAKMALIWSKMTTGLPFEIKSARFGQSFVSHYRLDIDIHKNEPNVHASSKEPNKDGWHGAEISLIISGNWSAYRSYIMRYLRGIAVITPYAEFSFSFRAEVEKNNLSLRFVRRTDVVPKLPRTTPYHPSAVDLELIKRLATITKAPTLKKFLSKEFSSISNDYASRLIAELQVGLDENLAPSELTHKQIARLHQLLHEARFDDPSSDHLSPAGEYNLRLGVLKEIDPELLATYQGSAQVMEGHAFIVEAAVSIGGASMKPGINCYRYANRIPLLFEAGSDVVTRTANKRVNWTAYKINQATDKIGVFVSIVSTKIPFKGAGKEYIGDDIPEMVAAVKQAIQACCLQLKGKIAKQAAAREQRQRKKVLLKYVPNAAASIFKVLSTMSETAPRGVKRKALQERHSDVLQKVRREEVVAKTLEQRLREHVERIDNDMALDYQMQAGAARGRSEKVFLVPRGARHVHGPELHSATCVFKPLVPP